MSNNPFFTISSEGCFISNKISKDAFIPFKEKALASFNDIKNSYNHHALPALSIINTDSPQKEYEQTAKEWQKRFKTIVLFGTGGSSLGAQTCIELLQTRVSKPSNAPFFLFMDNIDPYTFGQLLENLDVKTTGFLVISKSGTTAETLSQVLTLISFFQSKLSHDQVLVITEPKNSPLRRLAEKNYFKIFDHPLTIGGRFSIFSIVGMLPALIAGINIQDIHAGARQYLSQEFEGITSYTTEGAALSYAYYEQFNCTQTVLMPYIDRLSAFALWFRQLWAESLGKEQKGITPINAIGTVDQHSQLQLYLGGPRDKIFTLIMLDAFKTLPKIETEDPELSYLNQHSIADLMRAEQNATASTLISQGCPTRIINLPHLNEKTLGGLFMHYMLETIITANMLEIDAFDQPAVEEGKILTREYLTRKAS